MLFPGLDGCQSGKSPAFVRPNAGFQTTNRKTRTAATGQDPKPLAHNDRSAPESLNHYRTSGQYLGAALPP